MQTRSDETHVILPAAALTNSRPNRAGLPVTLLRHSDGKMRHDGSSAATMQPNHTVAERGRLHGVSELNGQKRNRSAENRFAYYRRCKDGRRSSQSIAKHNRLRWQDKRAHIAPRFCGCYCWIFWCVGTLQDSSAMCAERPSRCICVLFPTLQDRAMDDEREFRIRPGRIRSTRAQQVRPFIAQALAAAKKAGGGIRARAGFFTAIALGLVTVSAPASRPIASLPRVRAAPLSRPASFVIPCALPRLVHISCICGATA